MLPLSTRVPPDPTNFLTCHICDHVFADICEVNLHQECDLVDGKDIPSERYIVACKSKACHQVIEEHELMYQEVPWSRGGPGKFILMCGDCKHRKSFTCMHPNLKSNGGEGLKIYPADMGLLSTNISVCMTDGSRVTMPFRYNKCEGQTPR